jgi:hypothetical protein
MPSGFFGVAFDGVCCCHKICLDGVTWLPGGLCNFMPRFQSTTWLSLRNYKYVLRRATFSNKATHEEVHPEQTRSPLALPLRSGSDLALGNVPCTESTQSLVITIPSSLHNSTEILEGIQCIFLCDPFSYYVAQGK